ncbi:MAG: hypothetical protein ACLQPH_13015 [Acidimicrobiales bacterium]
MVASTWELENMRAHARMGTAWSSDAGLALQAESMGANPPAMQVAGALHDEIPL